MGNARLCLDGHERTWTGLDVMNIFFALSYAFERSVVFTVSSLLDTPHTAIVLFDA